MVAPVVHQAADIADNQIGARLHDAVIVQRVAVLHRNAAIAEDHRGIVQRIHTVQGHVARGEERRVSAVVQRTHVVHAEGMLRLDHRTVAVVERIHIADCYAAATDHRGAVGVGYVCDVQHRQRTVCNHLRRIVGEGTDVGQSEIAAAIEGSIADVIQRADVVQQDGRCLNAGGRVGQRCCAGQIHRPTREQNGVARVGESGHVGQGDVFPLDPAIVVGQCSRLRAVQRKVFSRQDLAAVGVI